MNGIFYRLGGYEETWRQLPGEVYGPHVAQHVAEAVQRALRHVGYYFAQAEARPLEDSASGVVPAGGLVVIGEHFPGQEAVTLPPGLKARTVELWGEHGPQTVVIAPAVEVGHGETPPEGYGG